MHSALAILRGGQCGDIGALAEPPPKALRPPSPVLRKADGPSLGRRALPRPRWGRGHSASAPVPGAPRALVCSCCWHAAPHWTSSGLTKPTASTLRVTLCDGCDPAPLGRRPSVVGARSSGAALSRRSDPPLAVAALREPDRNDDQSGAMLKLWCPRPCRGYPKVAEELLATRPGKSLRHVLRGGALRRALRLRPQAHGPRGCVVLARVVVSGCAVVEFLMQRHGLQHVGDRALTRSAKGSLRGLAGNLASICHGRSFRGHRHHSRSGRVCEILLETACERDRETGKPASSEIAPKLPDIPQ